MDPEVDFAGNLECQKIGRKLMVLLAYHQKLIAENRDGRRIRLIQWAIKRTIVRFEALLEHERAA
jgi:hypothetical protein